jgi:hypothetical protein
MKSAEAETAYDFVDEALRRKRERKESDRKDQSNGRAKGGHVPGFEMKPSGLYVEVEKGAGKNARTEEIWLAAPFRSLGGCAIQTATAGRAY